MISRQWDRITLYPYPYLWIAMGNLLWDLVRKWHTPVFRPDHLRLRQTRRLRDRLVNRDRELGQNRKIPYLSFFWWDEYSCDDPYVFYIGCELKRLTIESEKLIFLNDGNYNFMLRTFLILEHFKFSIHYQKTYSSLKPWSNFGQFWFVFPYSV